MTRMTTMLAAVALAAGCAKEAPTTTSATSATGTASTTGTGSPAASATTASASASVDPEENEPPPAKAYDCGAKGQKPCPMQGWMKRVMGPASSSGDGPKLAEALAYAAKKPPKGFTDWTAMANDGAAKAKAGDIEGAKASCKKCHERYKQSYKATMRDAPW